MAKLVPDAETEIRIYTPPDLARRIVEHYQPRGTFLDPCKGKGAFYNAARAKHPNPPKLARCDWMEIDEGRDFLKDRPPLWKAAPVFRYDWIITNPPWGRAFFLPFLVRSMQTADNVVFLALVPNYFQTSKINAMRDAGFAVKEILYVTEDIPAPWPRTGFALGAVHVARNWHGGITETFLPEPAGELSTANHKRRKAKEQTAEFVAAVKKGRK